MDAVVKMVALNIVIVLILIVGIYVYTKIYPKKKIKLFYLLLLVSLHAIISIFRPGGYESGDFAIHAMRSQSFYTILFTEHTLPRWAPELSVGYGDMYFQFIYILPYVLISLLHHIGLSFIFSIKFLLAISFLISGIIMYRWAKDEFGEKGGFTAGIFYLYGPYHLIDLHFRVTIAENLAYILLPLQFYIIKKFVDTSGKIAYVNALILTTSLFVITHQPTFLISFPVIFIYALIKWREKHTHNKKLLLSYVSTIIISLALTSFYWMPILSEAKYIHHISWGITYTSMQTLLYAPWRYGFLFQGHKGELGLIIGYTQLFIVLVSLVLIVRKKIPKKCTNLLYFFLISFIFYTFMIVPFSKPLWDLIPLINNIQFSYRLLIVIVFVTSALSAIVVTIIHSQRFFVILCTVTILYTLLNWGHRTVIEGRNDTFYKNELLHGPSVMGIEPTTPKWVPDTFDLTHHPKQHIEILTGKGKVIELKRTSTYHEYLVYADTNIRVKENTFYFPGWSIEVNDTIYPFTYDDAKYPGVMMISLPKGFYKVTVKFNDTFVRAVSKQISIGTLLLIVGGNMLHKMKSKNPDRKKLKVPSSFV